VSSPVSNQKFEDYFSKLYHERWPKIRQALTEKERQVLRLNKYSKEVDVGGLQPCDFLENCYWRPEGHSLQKNKEGLYDFYVLDPASVFVARALQAEDGERILDMCAAPGGKSLIIAEMMSGGVLSHQSELISNEMSEGRRERLMRVFHEYIPRENRETIFVKGLDGNQYGLRQPDHFNRVLADVPCSGERHLLENPKEFEMWSEKRTKNLAIRQYSLLSSAWLCTILGGRIVYSTCSISNEENDAVVAKLIKKRKVKILRINEYNQHSFIEETEFGYQILPDRSEFGPMYFSVIEKV
jgi:16S rRNA C967 or C1407 C5-methylase (RsmB/RsmF family)